MGKKPIFTHDWMRAAKLRTVNTTKQSFKTADYTRGLPGTINTPLPCRKRRSGTDNESTCAVG